MNSAAKYHKKYLRAVGYVSTVDALTIFEQILHSISTMKNPICKMGIFVNTQDIEHNPVPTNMKTKMNARHEKYKI